MKFSGGLTKLHANRGVFITTSNFTKVALEFVEAMPQKIILIDGMQLYSACGHSAAEFVHRLRLRVARAYALATYL